MRGYSDSGLRIGAQHLTGSCIVTAQRLITDWEPAAYGELAPAHLESDLRAVTGGGAARHRSAAAVREPRGARRIRAAPQSGLEVMHLGAACRTFNVLVQEERRGGRGTVRALGLEEPAVGGKATSRRHKGRVNQPNNHSKLTDSNNCTVFFILADVIAFVATPSSLCLLPVALPL